MSWFASLFGKIWSPKAPTPTSYNNIGPTEYHETNSMKVEDNQPSYLNVNSVRPISSLTGSQFCNQYYKLSLDDRDAKIVENILSGNVPEFIKKFCELKLVNGANTITLYVLPDYLSIGDDDDFVRMPMSAKSAQKIADALNCSLPTKKLVDLIYKYSINKANQNPMGPPYDATMWSLKRIFDHNTKCSNELIGKDKSLLTAGHKKDIIIDNALAPNNPRARISIYGWHGKSGIPIQGPKPQSFAHAVNFQDYSQCVRLISNECLVNGNKTTIQNVFNDKILSLMINEDGVLRFKKY